MKITRTNKDDMRSTIRREKANQGCDICPCCGESKTYFDYLEEHVEGKGIIDDSRKVFTKGLFKKKIMQIDCYTCHSCGAEWQSDPYEL